jgi:hypothetical protein
VNAWQDSVLRDVYRASVVYLLIGAEGEAAHWPSGLKPLGGLMRDAHESPDTEPPTDPALQDNPADPPDPADLGTAYGMELSIGPAAKQAPAEEDLNDPLGWIRRWVDQHKPA